MTERKLNDKGLLEPNTYPEPSAKMRYKYALKKNWPILPFIGLLLSVTSYVVAVNGFTGGTFALLGLILVVLGMGVWAAYFHAMKNFHPYYEVLGINIRFTSTKYYVPPEVMKPFIQEVFDSFESATDLDPKEMFEGVSLVIKDERPRDPAGRVEPERIVGVSYTRTRQSRVYGPYALSHGGAGYELRLQGCNYLFPGRSEEEDIAWMKENDVI